MSCRVGTSATTRCFAPQFSVTHGNKPAHSSTPPSHHPGFFSFLSVNDRQAGGADPKGGKPTSGIAHTCAWGIWRAQQSRPHTTKPRLAIVIDSGKNMRTRSIDLPSRGGMAPGASGFHTEGAVWAYAHAFVLGVLRALRCPSPADPAPDNRDATTKAEFSRALRPPRSALAMILSKRIAYPSNIWRAPRRSCLSTRTECADPVND